MKLTVIRVMPDCPDGKTCPSLAETDRGSCIVVGKVVREVGALDALAIGDDGRGSAGGAAGQVIDVLSERELDEFFAEHFRHTAFRLEVRDHYQVASDGGDLVRYLAGEDMPDAARKNAWLDELRADTAAGKHWQWVHVVRGPLSDYLRYACEWGYAINILAGAEVRILDLAERPQPAGVPDEDFWILDDEAVLIMRYDGSGRYLGAEPAPVSELPRYRRARDAAWRAAEPFADYWPGHPQYHRDQVA